MDLSLSLLGLYCPRHKLMFCISLLQHLRFYIRILLFCIIGVEKEKARCIFIQRQSFSWRLDMRQWRIDPSYIARGQRLMGLRVAGNISYVRSKQRQCDWTQPLLCFCKVIKMLQQASDGSGVCVTCLARASVHL
jgi:hypothetical protein